MGLYNPVVNRMKHVCTGLCFQMLNKQEVVIQFVQRKRLIKTKAHANSHLEPDAER